MDTTLDPQAKALAQAIKRAETGEGDTYNMEGKSGEFGAYQFMPDTYKAYAKKYLGDENAEPNKENQNKIAYSFVKEKKDAGFTPAQIASMWNAGEGRPNAYKEGHRGVNQRGVNYDTPKYAANVSEYYRTLTQGVSQETPTVPQQREQMIAQGQPVSVNEERAEPTAGGKFLRGIIRPFATLAARPIQLAKAIGGATEEEQKIKSKYLGDIETSKSGKDVLKDVGRGLEAVSYGIGGGAGAQAVKGLGRQGLRQTIKQTAKEGLVGGAVGGAGMAIGEGKSAGEVAGSALLGGILGAGAAGTLGAGANLLGRGARGVKQGIQATGMVPVGEKSAQRAIDSVATEYERAAGTGLKPAFRKKQLAMKGDFKPWSTTLAEYGIVPEEGANKAWDVDKALLDLDGINDQFRASRQYVLKNDSTIYNVDEALKAAEDKIDESIKSELARNKAKARIRDEVEAALANKQVQTGANGERLIPATEMEFLKDIGYELTPFDATDPQRIMSSAGYSLAKAVNETVDKYTQFPSYRALNREWSNILNAKEALSQLSTKNVRISKGLSGQIALKTLGPLFGFSQGGILGAVLGDLGAETAGRVFSDPQLRTFLQRAIIRNSKRGLPKDQLINTLRKEVDDFLRNQEQLLRLPAPSPETPVELSKLQNPYGAVELGEPERPLTRGQIEANKFMQDQRVQQVIPRLPAPSTIYKGPTQEGLPFTPNQQFGTTPVVETKTEGLLPQKSSRNKKK